MPPSSQPLLLQDVGQARGVSHEELSENNEKGGIERGLGGEVETPGVSYFGETPAPIYGPPKKQKPEPKPPTPVYESSKKEKPEPEHKPPAPVYKPPKKEKPEPKYKPPPKPLPPYGEYPENPTVEKPPTAYSKPPYGLYVGYPN
ncbi:hypothetical protein SLEP1_g29332 [Rubroshorea leprosula]|uniref:Uncharacterized protein n=1 Tax=Rubroshorea leprosula TaxID=152421 RepID=A0AAV5JZ36_9ROSI|nr:hypothetical protein SLEP1_g29332 [Rubroshorea leprosula]